MYVVAHIYLLVMTGYCSYAGSPLSFIIQNNRRTSHGEPLPINIAPALIPDGVPTDSEVWDAVRELTNGHSGGASKMRAEHMKEWLQGIQREEDPKQCIGNRRAGGAWRLLMQLVNAVW